MHQQIKRSKPDETRWLFHFPFGSDLGHLAVETLTSRYRQERDG